MKKQDQNKADQNKNREIEKIDKKRKTGKLYRIELCDLNSPEGDLLANVVGKSLNPTWPRENNK